MKTGPARCKLLAGKIEATERKLQELAIEIEEIGEPASGMVRHRLEALKIEESALQRNFAEAQSAVKPGGERMRKIDTLLHHIEKEEASLEHEADFLHSAAPTTLEFAMKGGAYVYTAGARVLKGMLGGHQLMWHSPFVNNTHRTLSTRYKMPQPKP
jgi:chromosome segregation ATPase